MANGKFQVQVAVGLFDIAKLDRRGHGEFRLAEGIEVVPLGLGASGSACCGDQNKRRCQQTCSPPSTGLEISKTGNQSGGNLLKDRNSHVELSE
jgi:hypothetical protein